MSLKRFAVNSMHGLRIGLTSLALFQFSLGGPLASTAQAQTDNDIKTTSPIKHVIVIIGENRSYDDVFATYVPKSGQTTMNLLSEGIIKADATPGPNFDKAHQPAAVALAEKKPLDYHAHGARPVHRFYQMWQQLDCSREHITEENGSGCNAKLFSWVEVTVGAGTNGKAQPADFDTNYFPGATTTGEGSTALGFY